MEGELRESTESVGVDPTWLCGTWALISCCAWAYSLFQVQSDSLSGGALTACAFALAFIGYWVRRRALDQNSSMQEGKREIPNHSLTGLAMMLGLAASVNWLGVLVQYSASLGELIPTLVIFVCAELALDVSSRWQQETRESPSGKRELELVTEAPEVELPNENLLPAIAQAHFEDSPDDGLGEEEYPPVRNTIEQYDLEGRRSLSGFVRTEFAAEQKKQELIVAFCPPFNSRPSIEFEPDDGRVQAQLLNCTPIGARILLQNTESNDSFTCQLDWYATSEDDDSENSLVASRILP